MNQAEFKILGITIPSGRYNYHDEGYVQSIHDAVEKICKKYGEDVPFVKKDTTGFYAGMGLDIYILYLQKPTKPLDIQNRAHEETHAVDYVGGLDFLSDRMIQEQGVKINLKEVDDEEVRAQLGSLYALHKHGFSERQLRVYRRDVRFAKAMKIWEQSRLLRKRWFHFFRMK